LKNSIDLVFGSIGNINETYKIRKIDNTRIIYFLKPEKRKRKGQIHRICQRFSPEDQDFEVLGMTKYELNEKLLKVKNSSNFKVDETPEQYDYNGYDLEVFEKKESWYPWQKEIYNLIFEKDNTFKIPHPRHIISILDLEGNSGKSSFFKWIFFHHPEDLGIISFGTTSQLRSSAVNLGPKKQYIIDLTRARTKEDKEESLLAIIEDLKSGLVVNPMFGSGRTLLMGPPHIIIAGNPQLNYELLSKERWRVFEITKDYKLKN